MTDVAPAEKPDDEPVRAQIEPDSIERIVFEMKRELYQGEFPHPDHMERFESLAPGATAMVFKNFEEQGRHRREIEKVVVNGDQTRANRGQVLGTIIVGAIILLGVLVAIVGQPVAGTVMVATSVGGGVLLAVIGGRPFRDKGKKKGKGKSTTSRDVAIGDTGPVQSSGHAAPRAPDVPPSPPSTVKP